MVLQIVLADTLLIARIFTTTQLVKHPRVLSVKPLNNMYVQYRSEISEQPRRRCNMHFMHICVSSDTSTDKFFHDCLAFCYASP